MLLRKYNPPVYVIICSRKEGKKKKKKKNTAVINLARRQIESRKYDTTVILQCDFTARWL